MMHSVLSDDGWDYSFLSTSLDELDRLIAFYRRGGFDFVKARELAETRRRSVCLTFDDGFCDNWTLLHPFLAQRKIPYTVFVNRDFVEKTDTVREWADRTPGYLSIGELKRMHESGLCDLQSHSATHTWYPIAGRVVDVFKPGDKAKYPWMGWNDQPRLKPYWLQADYSHLVGLPVFENDRSLRARRFVFDADKLAHFQGQVQADRLDADAANELLVREYPDIGRAETPAERQARYVAEIRDNAEFIREVLGYHPSVMCWPGGAFNDESEALAQRFHDCTTIKRGYGADRRFMHRLSPSNPYGRDRFPWKHFRLTLLGYTVRHAAGYLAGRARACGGLLPGGKARSAAVAEVSA